MARIRYLTGASIQVGTTPEDLVTYGGEDAIGKTGSVPDDIAALLVGMGAAEPVKGSSRKA